MKRCSLVVMSLLFAGACAGHAGAPEEGASTAAVVIDDPPIPEQEGSVTLSNSEYCGTNGIEYVTLRLAASTTADRTYTLVGYRNGMVIADTEERVRAGVPEWVSIASDQNIQSVVVTASDGHVDLRRHRVCCTDGIESRCVDLPLGVD
jgi:hypothetical protein